MEKVTTIVDDKANKELAKPTRILTWILAGIGGFCIGFYFTFNIITKSWLEPINIIMAVVGVIFIACGFFFDYRINKAIKLAKANPITTVTEFNEDHLVMESYKNNEKIAESKVEYISFKRYTVRAHFVFLTTQNNVTVAFTKSDELVEFMSKTGIKKM